ncbi:MAG: rhomboid family intramembrane serine protease [Planctomycetota bacterium]
MKDLIETADEIPVTLLVALAYLGLAALTDPLHPATATLVRYGAASGIAIADGEAWRLVSHAFLHGNLLHLMFNLYALIVAGPTLERSIGSARFALVYLVSAVAGGLAGSLWNHPLGVLVGGSGALFGMFGAFVALLARGGREPTEFVRSAGGKQLLGNIGLNLVLGMLIPFISNSAHIGGLLAGFALMWWFLSDPRHQGPPRRSMRVALVALFAGALLAALQPVHRWDYYLLAWEHSDEPARRDELRRALGLLTGDFPATDDDMTELAKTVDKLRRYDPR